MKSSLTRGQRRARRDHAVVVDRGAGRHRRMVRGHARLVAAWLAGIIVNLLSFPGYFDIALRDFGLLVGAVALARLATRYAPGRRGSSTA
ncbi:MAG: hypothetical protein ACRDTA_19115 [Pseudonocardiaceae bacterium]